MTDETKENVNEAIGDLVEVAEQTVRHPYTNWLARFGFYTKGFLFIVIGLIAVSVAFGIRNIEIAAPAGALTTIAQLPFGKLLLIVFIAGAIGHGIWNILRGAADIDDSGGGWQGITQRIFSASIGIFYLILAWAAWNIIITSQLIYSDGEIPRTLTTLILALPLGTILMILIGLGVVGAGVHECYSGISGKYKKNFRLHEMKKSKRVIITLLGIFSFTARALIFALMGYFFIRAAINYNPNEAIGMDGALLALSQTYYGKTLLFITAVGLICHGILSLYEARYRRIC